MLLPTVLVPRFFRLCDAIGLTGTPRAPICLKRASRWLALAGAIVSLTLSQGGCRICAECDVDDYAAYGAGWPRLTRDRGRVGSLFDPASAESSSIQNRNSALTPIERSRRESVDGADESDTESRPSELQPEPDDRPIENLRDLRLEELQADAFSR